MQILNDIENRVIPPYPYAYPTRASYRPDIDIDVFDIWKMEQNHTDEIINLYLHFPFCKYKCSFCNLYSIAAPDNDIQTNYTKALICQLKSYADIIASRKLRTIYIGGGTPMLLTIENFMLIVEALNQVSPNWQNEIEEFSIEASPDSIIQAAQTNKLTTLIENGVNRINIGIQSFTKNDIKVMGRNYNENVNILAINILKDYGVQNISTDLIAGFERQTYDDWIFSVNKMVQLEPHTISVYSLRKRPDSTFGRSGNVVINPPSIFYDWYELARQIILECGYRQETNVRFTRYDKAGYLQQQYQFESFPVLGVGAGARSYTSTADYIIGGGYPATNEQISSYIDNALLGKLKIERAFIMSDLERIRKMLVLNLYNFDIQIVHTKYGHVYDEVFLDVLNGLVVHGLLRKKDTIYSLTYDGIKYRDIISWGFFSNEVKKLDNEFFSNINC